MLEGKNVQTESRECSSSAPLDKRVWVAGKEAEFDRVAIRGDTCAKPTEPGLRSQVPLGKVQGMLL